jgi:deaminated glutathione amidase
MTLIAAIQMVSTGEVEENLATARRLIARAAGAGAELVSLPEYFCLISASDADRVRIGEPDGDGPIQAALATMARENRVWVIGGTLPIRAQDAARVRNASCVYAPDGLRAARYDKMHLFAYDNGTEAYDEGAVLEAGDTPVAVCAAGLQVGLSVCYDLRFPELYRGLYGAGNALPLDLIAAPSAFTYTTGAKHWELLLRARAVENQCYLFAAAQGGVHSNGRRTWGHTMIVDPWGDILDCVEAGEGIAMAAVDRERISAVRTQLPALAHRRLQ